jgi:hypothetical protein
MSDSKPNPVSNIVLAKMLSNMACLLDEQRSSFPKELQGAALICVDEMHDMAEALLGFDRHLVYAKDDPTAIAILRMAHLARQAGEVH